MNLTLKLDLVQEAIKERLEGHFYFADIPVLVEDKGDIEADVNQALGTLTEKKTKMGICVVVSMPGARCRYPNAPGPLLDPLSITLSVVEDVASNRGASGTGKPALAVVEVVLRLLSHWTSTKFNAAIVPSATPFQLNAGSAGLQYDVNFESKLGLTPIT
jgi:hypothetical protein